MYLESGIAAGGRHPQLYQDNEMKEDTPKTRVPMSSRMSLRAMLRACTDVHVCVCHVGLHKPLLQASESPAGPYQLILPYWAFPRANGGPIV